MAVHKLRQLNVNGTFEEYTGKSTSAGAGDAGEFVTLGGTGKLDPSVLPNGVGADASTLVAGEALVAGDFVYISVTSTVLKADATTIAKQAVGYVLSAVANGANATVFFDETNSALSGLTPGAHYFLSTTAGQVTLTPTITAGQICQKVGTAITATSMHVMIEEPTIRA